MLLLIALIVAVALAAVARFSGQPGLIDRHSYNNRANDASGARADHLG
jgi:hypothetical protein